jgi:hypothetical protein
LKEAKPTHPPPEPTTKRGAGNVTAADTDTWSWPDVRDAVERFGEVPGARLEAEIIDAFEVSPRRVVEEIDAVARDLASGRVGSGWGVLRARVEDAGPVRDVVVGDESEKQRRVARAAVDQQRRPLLPARVSRGRAAYSLPRRATSTDPSQPSSGRWPSTKASPTRSSAPAHCSL